MSRIVTLLRAEANSPAKHFRHTCYKKVFVKQHFLQNRRTQYTYLSTGFRILAPYTFREVRNDVFQWTVWFGFIKFSYSLMPD